MRMPDYMMRTIQAAVGVGLSVIAMEFALHAIERTPAWRVLPVVERELGWPDPVAGYALRPDQAIINVREHRARATTNGFGMRDRDRTIAKAPGVYRVAVTGDSFTEALQVDDDVTFTRLAEQALNAAGADRGYEVLNFGLSGAGPVQQWLSAYAMARRFAPDALILIVDPNQLLAAEMADDSMNPAYVDDGHGGLTLGHAYRGRASQRYRDTGPGRLFFALMDHSRVARAIYLYYAHGGAAAAVRTIPAPNCGRQRAQLNRQIALWTNGEPASAAARLQRWLEDLAALTDSDGPRVGVVFYGLGDPRSDCPQANAMRDALIATMREALAVRNLRLFDADALAAGSIPATEPLGSLRGFGRARGTGHLNSEGHRVYAGTLAGIVRALADGRTSGLAGDH